MIFESLPGWLSVSQFLGQSLLLASGLFAWKRP